MEDLHVKENRPKYKRSMQMNGRFACERNSMVVAEISQISTLLCIPRAGSLRFMLIQIEEYFNQDKDVLWK